MTDLSSLAADQLAETVTDYLVRPRPDWIEAQAALAELQTRANQRDERWQEQEHPFDASEFAALKARAEAAEKERDEAQRRVQLLLPPVARGIDSRYDHLIDRAEAAEARLAETQKALEAIAAGDFSFGYELAEIARAALTTHPAEAKV